MSIILRQNENLIKTARRHIIFLLQAFIVWPLILVGLWILRYRTGFDFYGRWELAWIVGILLVLLFIGYEFFLWARNVLLVTNQRLVENEQYSLFSQASTEFLFKDILEISYEKHGILAHIYDFGNVILRTAAENQIVVPRIAKPQKVVELINQIRKLV